MEMSKVMPTTQNETMTVKHKNTLLAISIASVYQQRKDF